MAIKKDWVKIIAIVLTVLFFLLLVLTNKGAEYLVEECEDRDLMWQQAVSTLRNCFDNDLAACNYIIPQPYGS